MIKKTILLLWLGITVTLNSQNENIETIIKHHDSIFWKGFNSCDLEIMTAYVSDDLEFYHDKSGLSVGKSNFIATTKKNLCNTASNWRLRRQVVKGSVKVFPLNNYGAIISGEHVFYVNHGNKPEYLDGIAKFTHVWHLKNGIWKMTRVLSYDHKPAPQNFDTKQIILDQTSLKSLTGSYSAPNIGTVLISTEKGILKIKTSKMSIDAYPNSNLSFFSKEAPLTFKFLKDSKGKILKMVVRERGNVVEELVKKN